ncbi:MAG: MATE family efflux transporter, partial [Clostridia bacterium]|nr:MATE family efflux transporter [Clostridia bacterium]
MSEKFANHFTFKKLLKLVYPSIIMMVFTSIYGVVDGVFVSNFAGTTPEQCETAFAAVNLIIPVIMAFASFGFMIGTGGSALISKLLGEGNEKRANGIFSLLIIVTVILGAVVTLVGEFTLRPIAVLLKAEGEILDDCVLYGTICLGGAIPFMLQNVFQSFFPVAGKHKLGLVFIVAAGLTNAALDAILIAGFKLGLAGAAAATVTGQVVGGIAPIIYFAACRKGAIMQSKPCFSIKSILKTFMNGSSEMITNLSLSVVNIIYND